MTGSRCGCAGRSLCTLLGSAVLVGLALVVGCKPAEPTPTPTGTAGWYAAYFTSPKYPDRASDHHGGLDEKLTAFVNSATSSVDVAIYQLDLENVTSGLLKAASRGVRVRVVTDVDTLDDAEENASFVRLKGSGIPVVGGNPNGIMHDKFVVVDSAAVWTGSWNFTENETYRYNNDAILISSPALARNYAAAFDKMFNQHEFGEQRKRGGTTPRLVIDGIQVENYFAPEDDATAKIASRISHAKSSVDFMAFSFTDDTIGGAVLERARAGVPVRGVFETSGSDTSFSEYGKMQAAGLDVWRDGNPSLMHHKVFVVDGATVIFGSFNFSYSAQHENDENLLIIDDASLAQQFESEFAKVYADAKQRR